MVTISYILSGLSFFMVLLFFLRQPVAIGFLFLFPKLAALALSRYWAILGLCGAIIGWRYEALWAVPMGLISTIFMTWYSWRCSREHNQFEKVFGSNWQSKITNEQIDTMVQKRGSWYLNLNPSTEPLWERDITFWTLPKDNNEKETKLLCDIWSPSEGKRSGLAFVYLHGSGWAVGDKDFGTRPLFRHLVSQGHTVVDVAYRLIPRVDIYEMVGDAKRAVAWIKDNAERYGVKPDKVVLAGGSAGAHIALLAGYTSDYQKLIPDELKGHDLSVCGLVSLYGPTNLYSGYNRYKLKRQPLVPIGTIIDHTDMRKAAQYAGRTDILLGGHPDEVPKMYDMASPTTHVHKNSPPTLLIQGDKDFLVPTSDIEELYSKLVESGVPAIKNLFPWTEHAFDIFLPQFSPPSQSAFYDIDRFLALLLNR